MYGRPSVGALITNAIRSAKRGAHGGTPVHDEPALRSQKPAFRIDPSFKHPAGDKQ
jgi:hypothetical protein